MLYLWFTRVVLCLAPQLLCVVLCASSLQVHFVDYGNNDFVPCSALRQMPLECFALPPQVSTLLSSGQLVLIGVQAYSLVSEVFLLRQRGTLQGSQVIFKVPQYVCISAFRQIQITRSDLTEPLYCQCTYYVQYILPSALAWVTMCDPHLTSQAFECFLVGVRPSLHKSPDGQWTKEAVTRFTELTFGKVLVADVSGHLLTHSPLVHGSVLRGA